MALTFKKQSKQPSQPEPALTQEDLILLTSSQALAQLGLTTLASLLNYQKRDTSFPKAFYVNGQRRFRQSEIQQWIRANSSPTPQHDNLKDKKGGYLKQAAKLAATG